MATKIVVELPGRVAHNLNQLIYVHTRDDAIPYRGVAVPTIATAETGTPLGICVGCKHIFGSLWALSVVVEGVVSCDIEDESPEIGGSFSNGLLNLGAGRVYVSPERIAPLPPLR